MSESPAVASGCVNGSSHPHDLTESFTFTSAATNVMPSNTLTTSSGSDHPLSDISCGTRLQPHISGNLEDFCSFFDDPFNWDWAIRTFPVEPGFSDRNVFVSQLPASFKDADLLAMFEHFGPVVSAKVMLNVMTGISKETGFVQFACYRDALRARAFLRLRPAAASTTPPMPEVLTQWARNKHDGGLYGDHCAQVRKLFIRNVPACLSSEDVKALVVRFGEIIDVSLHNDTYEAAVSPMVHRSRRSHRSNSSGDTWGEDSEAEASNPEQGRHETVICFVTFVDPNAAMLACREIHNTTPFDSCKGVPLMAKLAEDNSTRHARRQNRAPATIAATAGVPLQPNWSTVMPRNGNRETETHGARMGGDRHGGSLPRSSARHRSLQVPPPPMLSLVDAPIDTVSPCYSHPSTPQWTSPDHPQGGTGIPVSRLCRKEQGMSATAAGAGAEQSTNSSSISSPAFVPSRSPLVRQQSSTGGMLGESMRSPPLYYTALPPWASKDACLPLPMFIDASPKRLSAPVSPYNSVGSGGARAPSQGYLDVPPPSYNESTLRSAAHSTVDASAASLKEIRSLPPPMYQYAAEQAADREEGGCAEHTYDPPTAPVAKSAYPTRTKAVSRSSGGSGNCWGNGRGDDSVTTPNVTLWQRRMHRVYRATAPSPVMAVGSYLTPQLTSTMACEPRSPGGDAVARRIMQSFEDGTISTPRGGKSSLVADLRVPSVMNLTAASSSTSSPNIRCVSSTHRYRNNPYGFSVLCAAAHST